nr:MAG TPA: hypothetical protein [Caudoviricetes sp.]
MRDRKISQIYLLLLQAIICWTKNIHENNSIDQLRLPIESEVIFRMLLCT